MLHVLVLEMLKYLRKLPPRLGEIFSVPYCARSSASAVSVHPNDSPFLSPSLLQMGTQLRAAEPVPVVSDTQRGSCRAWVCPQQFPVLKPLSLTTLPSKEMGCLRHLFLLVGSWLGKPKQWRHRTARKKETSSWSSPQAYPCLGSL